MRGYRSRALALALAAAAVAPSLADGPPQAELWSEATDAPSTTAFPTTAPPSGPDHGPVSVVTTAVNELEDALKKSNKQWFNASVAGVGGVLLVFFSERALEAVIMALAAVIFCNLGMVEVSKFWHSDIENFASGPLRMVIGIEFGLLGALVAKKGKDGILVLIAVIAGFTLSEHLEAYLSTMAGPLSKWCTVLLYSLVTIVFILVAIPIQKGMRAPAGAGGGPGPAPRAFYVHLLVVLGPCVGAPLIMSCFWYFVTLLHHALKDRDGVMPPWSDFLAQLWSLSASPVGLFTKCHFEVMNHPLGYDRLIGYVGWLGLAVAGVLFQKGFCRKAEKAEAEADKVEPSTGPAPPTGSMDSLTEALLTKESNETAASA